jgi:lysophospholipase L1-like esterase
MGGTLIASHSRFVLIGDSITDCGRARPVGEGLFDPYGNGYVNMLKSMIVGAHPDLHIRVTNMGESGNTVRDLKAQWDRDVVALKPEWLSVMIGINDVWRQFDMPDYPENHVLPDEFGATLEALLTRTRPLLEGLVLATPYFIEPNLKDRMRARMDEYSTIVRTLAVKHQALLVDTQAAFDEALKHMRPMELAWDRVHPNTTGHMIIARAFAAALEIG